jgi:outer membrane protein assembly factor BamB
MKLIILLVCLALPIMAADWPQWRGPQRNGVSSESGLLSSWPADGPKQVWKTSGLGEGFAGFSIAQGQLYTQGQRGGQEYVMAFDTATGKKLWETPTGRPYREQRGNGPRGTPTIDGGRLYAEAADGTLVALEVKTGGVVWKVNFEDKFGGSTPHWGYSESPLVDGDHLIVTPGGSGASVVALDKNTGNLVWKSQSDRAGYSSPILVETGGVRQIVVFTAEGVMGLRADNGKLLWRYDKVANNVANIATPIYQNGYLFVSSDYGTGCALLKLTAEGDGVRATEVYFNRDMRNHYSSSVVMGNTVFGYSSSVLTAMNLQTGKVAWRDRSVGKGSVTLVGGNLYLFSEDGVVGLAEANPEQYKEKSRFSIPRGSYNTWTPPVISDGRMYLREQDNLYCYNVRN